MEKIKEYDDPNVFWKEVSPHLKVEEAKNCMALGLSFSFLSEPANCIYQSACFTGDQFLGSLILTQYRSHYILIVNAVDRQCVASQLYSEFSKKNLPFTGIVGEATIANQYRELAEHSGLQAQVHMKHGIYRCRKVEMSLLDKSLIFRAASLKDRETVSQWFEEFQKEAVPHDPPVNGSEIAKEKINDQMIYVLEKQNELVSMAAWDRDIQTSCSINFVYTPKSLRKNGFASVVTAKLTKHLLDNGKNETNLYTDMSNPTSNKIYTDIGYEFVCASIHFGTSSKPT